MRARHVAHVGWSSCQLCRRLTNRLACNVAHVTTAATYWLNWHTNTGIKSLTHRKSVLHGQWLSPMSIILTPVRYWFETAGQRLLYLFGRSCCLNVHRVQNRTEQCGKQARQSSEAIRFVPKMSRRRLLNVGCALWKKSSSGGLRNPVALCASFATSPTQNEQKCCKEGQKCATNTAAAPLRHHHGNGKAKGEESFTKSGRSFSSTAPQIEQKTYLWARYNEMKRLVHGKSEEKSFCTTIL